MPLIDDWKDRHPTRSSTGRVILYIFLLAAVIFFMFRSDSLVRGFARIFLSSDSTETSTESLPETAP